MSLKFTEMFCLYHTFARIRRVRAGHAPSWFVLSLPTQIYKHRFRSAALRRLLVSVSTIVVAFLIAAVLMTWSGQFGDNFDGSFVDGLYFTLTTLTTIGYGDISPTTKSARTVTLVLMMIMLLDLPRTVVEFFVPSNLDQIQQKLDAVLKRLERRR